MKIIKYLMFIIFPVLSVFICVMLRLAQGEKVEEIVFGIMLGFVLDIIYLVILLINKKVNSKRTKQPKLI